MTDHRSTAVQVTAPARLHFGLLDVRSPFGGCGVMIDHPATVIRVSPAPSFSADPSIAARAEKIMRRLGDDRFRVQFVEGPPPHCGLGSGTQLSLAIAEAVLRIARGREVSAGEVIALADRGHRSAVGTHGYFSGGFVAEGIRTIGDGRRDSLNPTDAHLPFPEPWRVSVILPRCPASTASAIAGVDEQQRFDALLPVNADHRAQLIGRIDNEMVPAIEAAEFNRFVATVHRYNRESGRLFAPVQGGVYQQAADRWIRQAEHFGAVGVGQSSWGPGVFCWHRSAAEATRFAEVWDVAETRIVTARAQSAGRDVREFFQRDLPRQPVESD